MKSCYTHLGVDGGCEEMLRKPERGAKSRGRGYSLAALLPCFLESADHTQSEEGLSKFVRSNFTRMLSIS